MPHPTPRPAEPASGQPQGIPAESASGAASDHGHRWSLRRALQEVPVVETVTRTPDIDGGLIVTASADTEQVYEVVAASEYQITSLFSVPEYVRYTITPAD